MRVFNKRQKPCVGFYRWFADGRSRMLTWEDSYAIALALRKQYKDIGLEMVSLGMVYRWTLELPDFDDDRELANEAILEAIYQEWFEQENPL